ncbi:MAG: precorrin-2 C(20)-methyltransferase [Hyphomicrobiaceae bacterium]|nr:precorrin-2 C(20)-methyltransferase [Hyphomicrobiaceae bacterium]
MSDKTLLYGVGTGPGDPELMTIKAVKALERSQVIAFFAKRGAVGNTRKIADQWITSDKIELPLYYPLTTELDYHSAEYIEQINGFFDEAAQSIRVHLQAGRTVSILSIGDPLFYGSYMHLHERLAHEFPTSVIPGITAMSGCWSLAGASIAQGEDVLCVLPGIMGEERLAARLEKAESVVIMKVGQNLAKIRRVLAHTGKLERAIYVERGTMEGGRHMKLVDKQDDEAPYFSLILVPGWSVRS